jgi:hypothetical protein
MQHSNPSLEMILWFPVADYSITLDPEIHAKTEFVIGRTAETIVSFELIKRIFYVDGF